MLELQAPLAVQQPQRPARGGHRRDDPGEELGVEFCRLDVRFGQVGDLGHQLADLVLRLLEQTGIDGFFRHGSSRRWGHAVGRGVGRRALRLQRDAPPGNLPEVFSSPAGPGRGWHAAWPNALLRTGLRARVEDTPLRIESGPGMSMTARRVDALVTGATGLLGSHIAERLVMRGDRVRALVRPGSRTDFLESLGVELI